MYLWLIDLRSELLVDFSWRQMRVSEAIAEGDRSLKAYFSGYPFK